MWTNRFFLSSVRSCLLNVCFYEEKKCKKSTIYSSRSGWNYVFRTLRKNKSGHRNSLYEITYGLIQMTEATYTLKGVNIAKLAKYKVWCIYKISQYKYYSFILNWNYIAEIQSLWNYVFGKNEFAKYLPNINIVCCA